MEKFKYLPKEKIFQLPKTTGVYAFKKGRGILYVGKAINIRERVKNHFAQPSYRDSLFINQVKIIGYIKTNSEIEALVWEANLIKKYQPKYNIVWRDDKNYFYVGVTREDFPQIFITHQTQCNAPRPRYIGPFVDGKALKLTLKNLRKVLPFRSCKILPKKPCLWYQLDRCLAPCCVGTAGLLKSGAGKQISGLKTQIKNDSQRNIKNLIKILQGKKKQALNNLKKEMKKAANLQKFEKAKEIRDQITALEKILAHAQIFEIFPRQPAPKWEKIEKELKKLLGTEKEISRIEAYDVSNIQGKEATGSMVTFIKGLPDKNFYRRFKVKLARKPNDTAMLKEILKRRFKHPEWGWPDLILIDGGRSQLNAALASLNSKIKRVKVVALAKKKNELFVENKKEPILGRNLLREIFNLILQLRDEAHRFAISYHRKLRKKELLK